MLSNTISLVVMYSYTGLVSSSSSSTGLLFFDQITMTATPLTNPISSKTKNNTAASIQGVLGHSVDFVVVVLTSVVDSSVTDEFRDNLSYNSCLSTVSYCNIVTYKYLGILLGIIGNP